MSDSTCEGRAARAAATTADSSKGARTAAYGNNPGEEDLGSSQPAPPLSFPNSRPFMPGAEPGEEEGTRPTWSLSSGNLETPSEQVRIHRILYN